MLSGNPCQDVHNSAWEVASLADRAFVDISQPALLVIMCFLQCSFLSQSVDHHLVTLHILPGIDRLDRGGLDHFREREEKPLQSPKSKSPNDVPRLFGCCDSLDAEPVYIGAKNDRNHCLSLPVSGVWSYLRAIRIRDDQPHIIKTIGCKNDHVAQTQAPCASCCSSELLNLIL